MYIHKYLAGSEMERVGVSNSLLGTYDQHWDLPVILSLALRFLFFVCVLPQRQANFVKMPLPPAYWHGRFKAAGADKPISR